LQAEQNSKEEGVDDNAEDDYEIQNDTPKKKVYSVWPSSQPTSSEKILHTSDSTIPYSTASYLTMLVEEETKEKPEDTSLQTEKESDIITVQPTNLKEILFEESKKLFKRAGEHDSNEIMNNQQDSISSKPKRQHHGLRCNRCFALLVRDKDFEYLNGRLYVDKQVLSDKTWEGLIIEKGKVFCKNMHAVGYMEPSTWTNKTIYSPVIRAETTTFENNFLNNPEFAGADFVQNKTRIEKISYPVGDPQSDPYYRLKAMDGWTPDKMIPDRYHIGEKS